jgi:hypothetical protein
MKTVLQKYVLACVLHERFQTCKTNAFEQYFQEESYS